MKNLLTILAFTLCVSPTAWALDWPQAISVPEGDIIVYQPQPEALEGQTLSGRAAFQLDLKDTDEPIFGAMWFTARLDTDRDTDTATLLDFKVEAVTWPESKDAQEQRLTAVVENAFPDAGFDISLEALAASLETAQVVQQSLEDLNTEPPKIVFARDLSVLLLFDGQPRLAEIEGSDYERVLNTPFAVACKKRGKGCWLSSGTFWYEASDPMGPWAHTNSPPQDLAANMPAPEESQDQPDRPPAIVVATEPTELIVTVGAPEWTSLEGGELLYASNTESPWLRDLPTGNMYVLLSGRWYRAKNDSGPWTFVPPDELPQAFADIPPASDIGGLRTSVAGTPEAQDAVRNQAIPQTAAIDRESASLTVEYDGKPEFEKIKGTDVSYAINTGAQVLEIDGRYFAADNGVWFVSSSAQGPWAVADEVPEDQIAAIPPTSPVYNTTHVHVYESTPDVVYVGYTPGYMGSYPYYGVPVYGTGWYYPPYYGRWYYPRPATWGFNVGYNPWTGWSFGLSWSNGFFRFGTSWGGGYGGPYRPWGCCGGWYGGGYRGPVFINNGNINIGNNVSVGNRTRISNQLASSNRLANIERGDNLYQRPANRDRTADRSAVQRDLKRSRDATGKLNNVYAGANGQVARPNGDKWQTRENGQWRDTADRVSPQTRDRAATAAQNRPGTLPQRPSSGARPGTRPGTMPANPYSGSLNTRDLNRASQARQRGHANNRSRPAAHSRPTRRR